jgi:hypothetical protein
MPNFSGPATGAGPMPQEMAFVREERVAASSARGGLGDAQGRHLVGEIADGEANLAVAR